MKAYLVKSDKKIAPFNDSPQDCLVTDRRLGDIQREVLSGLNIELREVSDAKLVEDNEEHLIFTDSLFFTSEILTEFIAASRKLETSTVGALKPGFTTLRSVVNTQDVQIYPDRVEYGLNYFPSGSAKDLVVPVIIDADEYTENIPMPTHMFGASEYTVPLTEKCLIQIDHWTNIWGANMCVHGDHHRPGIATGGARLRRSPTAPESRRSMERRFASDSFRWKRFVVRPSLSGIL